MRRALMHDRPKSAFQVKWSEYKNPGWPVGTSGISESAGAGGHCTLEFRPLWILFPNTTFVKKKKKKKNRPAGNESPRETTNFQKRAPPPGKPPLFFSFKGRFNGPPWANPGA
eukprot:FR735148.1.p3 GENE.FR735148.1~~FR735148.1.p3  ORF type:complete len:113 (+),score=46.22 FR735148.1:716-1054(+)